METGVASEPWHFLVRYWRSIALEIYVEAFRIISLYLRHLYDTIDAA